MRSLIKKRRKSLRLSDDEDRKADQAAKIVSVERGVNVAPSALIRELAMPGIDAILEKSAHRNGR